MIVFAGAIAAFLVVALILVGIWALWRTKFPPATTFAEGQRALSLWLMAAAGLFQAAVAVGIVTILVRGGWRPEMQDRIVGILGWTLIGALALQALVIGGLAVGGPVGRFSVRGGKDGIEAEMDGPGTGGATITTATTIKGGTS